MNQQNQTSQPNFSQEPQSDIQPETPKKPNLPNWASILIITVAVIIVGLVIYGAYRYFVPQPEPGELPTADEGEPNPEEELKVGTTTLAVIPKEHLDLIYKNYERMPISFSENGERFAYACVDFVVVNSQEHQKFDSIDPFIFSPDGQKIVYAADNGKLIVNGQIIKEYKSCRISQLKFSPNSQKLSYLVAGYEESSHENFVVVLNSQEDTEDIYNHINASSFTFSPDSQKIAYVDKEGDDYFVFANGQKGKKYAHIASFPIFSPDSQNFAYIARFTPGGDGFIVVNGEETKKSYYSARSLAFSPDGQKLAFIASERKLLPRREFHVLYDLETKEYWEGERHDGEIRSGILFSPDSQKIAYEAREFFVEEGVTKEGKEFVVVNDKEGEKYNSVRDLTFSPDSQKLAYIVTEGKNIAVAINKVMLEDAITRTVLNNPESESYNWGSVRGLVFSPNSQNFAYMISDHIVSNGLEDKEHDYNRVWGLKFSSDSKKISYNAREDNKLILVVELIDK